VRLRKQVPFDGVHANEQLRADLLICQAVAGQPRNLRLLGGQLVARADPPAHLLAGGDQLSTSPLGETLRTNPCEYVVGFAELSSGIRTPIHAP
jgi:hypothetical protein